MRNTIIRFIGLVSVFLILQLGSAWLFKKWKEAEKRSVDLELTISDLDKQARQREIEWGDSTKLWMAEIESLKMTKNNISTRYNALLKASSLKPKDIQNIAEVSTVTRSTDTVVAYVDNFGGVSAKLEDPFVNIDVNVFPDKSTIISYEMKDSLTLVHVQKKHSLLFGLIKWKEAKEVKVINHNPKAKVVSVRSIEVLE